MLCVFCVCDVFCVLVLIVVSVCAVCPVLGFGLVSLFNSISTFVGYLLPTKDKGGYIPFPRVFARK